MVDVRQLYSDRARDIKPSGIRKFFDIVSTMEDAISLGVGEPDFKTPWQVRRAGISAIEKGFTFYTSNWGLKELRMEISKMVQQKYHVHYHPDNEIIVTVGGSEAIDNAMRAFLSFGDEVLIPEPSFVCYSPLAHLAGGIPVPVRTREEHEFKLMPEDLKAAITEKTKLLILPYPNNPTGAIMNRQELSAIADVLKDTNVLVLSDEIYCDLTYKGEHVCFADVEGMRERTIVINGFSKSYAMTGWRVGWAMAPKDLIAPICKIHQYGIMSAPTISQFAAIEALRSGDKDIQYMQEQYDIRRRFVVSSLRSMGLSCFEPLGAFYVFPSIQSTGLSSDDFCERLLKSKKVAVVPGNAFGDCGEGFVRISYSYSMKHLKTAMTRIAEFLKELPEK